MNASARDVVSVEGDQQVKQRATPERNPFGPRPTKFGRSYGNAPRQHNGMHRRRKKKLRW